MEYTRREGWLEAALDIELSPRQVDEISPDGRWDPIEIAGADGEMIVAADLSSDGTRVVRLRWDPYRSSEEDARAALMRALDGNSRIEPRPRAP